MKYQPIQILRLLLYLNLSNLAYFKKLSHLLAKSHGRSEDQAAGFASSVLTSVDSGGARGGEDWPGVELGHVSLLALL